MDNTTHGHGGSYVIGKDGTRVLVTRTEDHPEGNRPRDEPQAPAQVKRPGKSRSAPAADPAPATEGGKQ